MTKKQEIISWFKSDRSFLNGLKLYNKYGRNLSFRNTLQRKGATDKTLNSLQYELAKCAGISEKVYKNMLKKPVLKIVEEVTKPLPVRLTVEQMAMDISIVDIDDLSWYEIRSLVSQLELSPKGRTKKDYISTLVDFKHSKLLEEIPVTVQKTIKLREEFPFLQSKDCPQELKILVNDMLSAYDAYVSAHDKLFDSISAEETQNLCAEVVENYIENQMIWKELNHYKENNELLGEHPIFEWFQRKSEIDSLSLQDKIKLKENLVNKLNRTRKLLIDEPDHDETESRKERVVQFEKELEYVNTFLNE